MTFLASLPEPSRSGDVLYAFLSILFEGAPYIFIGTLISGLIDAFLPAKFLDRVLPKNKVLSTFVAGFLGLIFPVCECAVVPVVRRLVQKGLPLSCGLTYLLSAPIINPIVMASTVNAFKEYERYSEIGLWAVSDMTMTIARVTLAYFVAVLIGLLVIRKKPADILRPKIAASVAKAREESAAESKVKLPFDTRLVSAMRTAMRDFLDTAMYFSIGVLLTSLFNTQVPHSNIEAVAGNEWFAVPSMMGLSFLLALCSTSDAFIVAPMGVFSNAAKLAFLVFGPMLDIKLVFMYSVVFRRRFVLLLSIALFVLVGLLCEPWVDWATKLKKLPELLP